MTRSPGSWNGSARKPSRSGHRNGTTPRETWPRTCACSSRPKRRPDRPHRCPARLPHRRYPRRRRHRLTPTASRSDSETRLVKIVPKGLRSFDRHDADFFLELLPGPRDREGLPDSLRFWKTRIESKDADTTFKVGLIYGPSGCGKSSMVKAGLLPRLGKDVLPVYIEATPEETEARLLRGLRKVCPDLLADMTSSMRSRRCGAGRSAAGSEGPASHRPV